METIWQGNVTEFSRAYDLICIMDQIHNYAVNQHRSFVMEHLEAWHARHEKLLLDALPPLKELNSAWARAGGMDDDVTEDSNAEFNPLAFLACMEVVFKQAENRPEWLRLKEDSKTAKIGKARATRERNRKLRKVVQKGSPHALHGRDRVKKTRGSATKAVKKSFGMKLRSSRQQT